MRDETDGAAEHAVLLRDEAEVDERLRSRSGERPVGVVDGDRQVEHEQADERRERRRRFGEPPLVDDDVLRAGEEIGVGAERLPHRRGCEPGRVERGAKRGDVVEAAGRRGGRGRGRRPPVVRYGILFCARSHENWSTSPSGASYS